MKEAPRTKNPPRSYAAALAPDICGLTKEKDPVAEPGTAIKQETELEPESKVPHSQGQEQNEVQEPDQEQEVEKQVLTQKQEKEEQETPTSKCLDQMCDKLCKDITDMVAQCIDTECQQEYNLKAQLLYNNYLSVETMAAKQDVIASFESLLGAIEQQIKTEGSQQPARSTTNTDKPLLATDGPSKTKTSPKKRRRKDRDTNSAGLFSKNTAKGADMHSMPKKILQFMLQFQFDTSVAALLIASFIALLAQVFNSSELETHSTQNSHKQLI